jgi:mRNA interferase RelE/StbE
MGSSVIFPASSGGIRDVLLPGGAWRTGPVIAGRGARRILRKIEALRHDLAGNVKRLKAFMPDYRLRVGNWRVLFEVKGNSVIIHEIKHRSEAYDR